MSANQSNTNFNIFDINNSLPTSELMLDCSSAQHHELRRDKTVQSRNDSKKYEIWLLGLFPLHGSWAGGLGQLPAVEIGLEDVNADPDILGDYTLHMTMNDTQVSYKVL